MAAPSIDYYAVLSVSENATQDQIREAYKKAALQHHPDRVPVDSPERPARTKRFQQINDAYFTLSNPQRRQDYNRTRMFQRGSSTNYDTHENFGQQQEHQHNSQHNQQQQSSSFFSSFPWSTFGFGGGSGGSSSNTQSNTNSDQYSNAQFASVFEEMLREEGMAEGEQARPTGKFWSMVGGLSGGAMGFIVANFPGAVAGAVAGNRLGAVRDTKGKSVYSVFQELPQADKARLLSELAAKVFAHAVGS